MNRNSNSTGRVLTKEADMISFQCTWYSPLRLATPTA
jgi:hypothetical protein